MRNNLVWHIALALFAFIPIDAAIGGSKDIPLPADISVEVPDETIGRELAAFSGKWYGEWRGDRTNTFMAEQIIVVERITQSSVTVSYVGLGRWGQLDGRRWNYRLSAEYIDGTLRFKLPTGTIVTCRKNPDGTISARGEVSGGAWVATMQRLLD